MVGWLMHYHGNSSSWLRVELVANGRRQTYLARPPGVSVWAMGVFVLSRVPLPPYWWLLARFQDLPEKCLLVFGRPVIKWWHHHLFLKEGKCIFFWTKMYLEFRLTVFLKLSLRLYGGNNSRKKAHVCVRGFSWKRRWFTGREDESLCKLALAADVTVAKTSISFSCWCHSSTAGGSLSAGCSLPHAWLMMNTQASVP